MKIYELAHNSVEWYSSRLGRATSSCFGQIITPKERKFSKSAEAYALRLISELATGEPSEKFAPSYWMERGSLLEAEAGKLYEFETGHDLQRGGFITDDAGIFGCSPDRRVGRDGFVEIKCPAPWVHLANLKSKAIDSDHVPQVQGQLFLGEREWVDWFSFHPKFPASRIKTYRDEPFIAALKSCLDQFQDLMLKTMEQFVADGIFEQVLRPAPIIVPVDGLAEYLAEVKDDTFPGDR